MKKKSSSIGYNTVQESFTMGESFVGYRPSSDNVADLMNEVNNWQKRRYLVSNILNLISMVTSKTSVVLKRTAESWKA